MTFSSLISEQVIAHRNNYGSRGGSRVFRFTPHHMAANLTARRCAQTFQNAYRYASATYCIGTDGTIVGNVPEEYRPYTSSSYANDRTAITVEVANSTGAPDWKISDAAWRALVNLAVDCCRRYGFRLDYSGSPSTSLTEHRMFSATACPGPFLHSQLEELERQVNAILDGSQQAPSMPQGSGGNPAPTTGPLDIIPVHYALRKLNGDWWPEVTNFNNSNSDGYAGAPYQSHDYLYAYVDRGQLRYRTHVLGGGWLPWVYKGDKGDLVNGCAGVGGKVIDGVQMYYTTPSGEKFRQVYYRSQTTKRAGYLKTCCDDGSTYDNYDGWAGMYGEPLDRLQVCVATRSPF